MSGDDAVLERLQQAMRQVQADCGDIRGCVLATPEGLVLAAHGSLGGDVAAAAASSLVDQFDRHLALLAAGPSCGEALLWTPASLWGVGRLDGRHVVLAQAAPACATGTLRLAMARLRRDLAAPLQMLEQSAAAP